MVTVIASLILSDNMNEGSFIAAQ